MQQASASSAKVWQKIVYGVLLLILMGIAIALMSIHLEDQVIMAYDEGRHGVNGYEMLRNEDFVVHTYQGEPDMWNLKPPLSYWLIALNLHVFGFHVFAFRLHSVIVSCMVMLLMAFWMKKRYGMTSSLLSLLFLVANSAVYGLNFARTGEADALHILFVTISMLCLLQSSKNVRWLYGCALGFGFSFMAKSFHAAIIPAMCLCFLVCTGEIRRLKLRNYLLLLLFGLLPILPWAVARYQRDGFDFLGTMFSTDVQTRFTAEVAAEEGHWFFYGFKLLQFPVAIACMLLGGAVLVRNAVQKRKLSREQIGLLIWVALPILLYSLSNSKLYHYIVPIMVPLAMGGALAALSLLRLIKGKALKAAFCLVLAAGVAWSVTDNFQTSFSRDDKGSMQATLADMLDRDMDSERIVYIHYGEGSTDWMQNDMLRALLSGDVICKNGGTEAFEEEEESALLVVDKEIADSTLPEYYPVYYESVYQYVFEK